MVLYILERDRCLGLGENLERSNKNFVLRGKIQVNDHLIEDIINKAQAKAVYQYNKFKCLNELPSFLPFILNTRLLHGIGEEGMRFLIHRKEILPE